MTLEPSRITPSNNDRETRFEVLRHKIGLVLGPIMFGLVLLAPMDGLSPEAHKLAAIIALVITFWVTEALPLAVTALLGPMLAVMLQVTSIGPAFAPMANPIGLVSRLKSVRLISRERSPNPGLVSSRELVANTNMGRSSPNLVPWKV